MRFWMLLGVAAVVGCDVPGDFGTVGGGDWTDDGGGFNPGETTGDDAFVYSRQSTMYASVASLVLHSDSDLGRAGMEYGITCDVYRSIGSIGTDYDYPGDDEEVLDVRDSDGALLIQNSSQLFVERADGGRSSVSLTGLVHSQFGGGGAVALDDDGGCGVDFVSSLTTAVRVSIDSAFCAGGTVSTSAVTPDAWVQASIGVVHVTPQGADPVDTSVDMVAWDDTTQALYAGVQGGSTLEAREADGTVRWSVDLGGGLTTLTAVPDLGAAGVFISMTDGTGEYRVYDGISGEIRSSLLTPGTPEVIATSDDGLALALVRSSQVHFFEASGL